jgi:hypothetical protein
MQSATIQKTDEKWLWKSCFVVAAIVCVMILNGAVNHSYHFRVLITAAGCDAIAFLAGYLSLKCFNTLAFGKFAAYLAILTGANWFFHMLQSWHWSLFLVGGDFGWFFCWLLPLLTAIILNIGFLKYLFKFDTRTAIPMGVLLGMTNAQSSFIRLYF